MKTGHRYKKICIECGTEYLGTSSTQKYCSIECSTVEIKCSFCKKPFRIRRSRIKIVDGEVINTCSRSCAISRQLQDKEFRDILRKAGTKNLIEYNRSEQGRRTSAKNGAETISIAIEAQQRNNRRRLCPVCSEITMHVSGVGCLKCHNRSINGPIECPKHGTQDSSFGGVCILCHNEEINAPVTCEVHGYMERSFGGQCCACISENTNSFNRERFYSSRIKHIHLKNEGTPISLDNIDEYRGVPGVWSIWSGNQCLDVCKTSDIGNEMLVGIRAISKGRENQGLSDSEINEKYRRRPGRYRKYRDIASYGDIIFKLVFVDQSKKIPESVLLHVELSYAHQNRAKYWSPEPKQRALISV